MDPITVQAALALITSLCLKEPDVRDEIVAKANTAALVLFDNDVSPVNGSLAVNCYRYPTVIRPIVEDPHQQLCHINEDGTEICVHGTNPIGPPNTNPSHCYTIDHIECNEDGTECKGWTETVCN